MIQRLKYFKRAHKHIKKFARFRYSLYLCNVIKKQGY